MKKLSLPIISTILVLVLSYVLPEVSYSKQSVLYASLLQLSSIILAITGAWAAIIYPDSLKNIMNDKDADGENQQVTALIKPMLISLYILGILIVSQIFAFIFGLLNLNTIEIFWFRKISLAIILFMYLLQIYSILATFIPIFYAKRKATFERNKKDKLNRIISPKA
jgi:uncharacterized membrane protein